VSPYLLAALLLAIGWSVPRMLSLRETRASALAYTECPWRGPARVTMRPHVTPADTVPVRRHEAVHAAQCDSLGPVRYRMTNLTAKGRLSLEAPAYCAGARARQEMGVSEILVRERLRDDARAAFFDLLDSATVLRALRAHCPELLRVPRGA
jgi:hypothetical protein